MTQKKLKRVFEIIPGATSWTILILPFIFSFVYPRGIAYFVICFDLYWLIKAIAMGVYLISGFYHMKSAEKIDWRKRCELLHNRDAAVANLYNRAKKSILLEKREIKKELKDLDRFYNSPDWQNWQASKIHHAVILADYKDEYKIIEASIQSCLDANWDSGKIYIVLALEEREGDIAKQRAKKIYDKFKNHFADIIITCHPDNLVGELKGKSANIKWAGEIIKQYFGRAKIDPQYVLVSAFDGDTRVSPEYFGCLTYHYLVTPERARRSYQPIPLFNNNIWEISPLNRIVAFGSSFWQMIESCRPYRLINFSSQAMSLETLIKINFWDATIVSEDSKQYYRAFFKFSGDHRAIPIFTPVLMDAVSGKTIWEMLKNQYLQKRRWAYGAENWQYVMIESIKHKEIPFWKKFWPAFRLFEGTVSWATASLLIAFAGWLPILLNQNFRSSMLAYTMPQMGSRLLTYAWAGVLVSSTVGVLLLPKRPKKFSRLKIIEMYLQWILVPISAVIFGSIPALDAQTRLMLGKYLGFWVTPKIRK